MSISLTLDPVSPYYQQQFNTTQAALAAQLQNTTPGADKPVTTTLSKSYQEMTVPEKLEFQKQMYELFRGGSLNPDFLQGLQTVITAQIKAASTVVDGSAHVMNAGLDKSIAQVRSMLRNV